MKNHRLVYLKVKIKSLAAEAKIIRDLEKKHKKHTELREGLHNHRKGIVRDTQFHTLLAYGFLRQKGINQIVPGCKRNIDVDKVYKMVSSYGTEIVFKDRIVEWIKH